MKGNDKVIRELNAALSAELSAIAQYMVQAEMCANWGYLRLSGLTKARAIEEMKHAEGLIERILFLDGIPGVDITLKPKIGATVPEQLKFDLDDEVAAVHEYNNAVKVCVAAGDDGSKELFDRLIQDEEHHVDFLEAQLHTIKDMGIANYLAQQMHNGE
ncbi:MAG: bacterioferritin [Terriglobales bacterium]